MCSNLRFCVFRTLPYCLSRFATRTDSAQKCRFGLFCSRWAPYELSLCPCHSPLCSVRPLLPSVCCQNTAFILDHSQFNNNNIIIFVVVPFHNDQLLVTEACVLIEI